MSARETYNALVVGVKDSDAVNMMDDVKEIARQYLALDLTPSEQKKNLEKVGKAMAKKWPQYFTGKDQEWREAVACRVAGKIHAHRRHNEQPNDSKDDDIIEVETASQGHGKGQGSKPAQGNDHRGVSMHEPRTADRRTRGASSSASRPLPTNGPSQVATPIHRLLMSCKPSMERFAKAFVSYGCVDEHWIRLISEWDHEDICHFVQNVALKAAQPMSDMEAYVLGLCFLNYYEK